MKKIIYSSFIFCFLFIMIVAKANGNILASINNQMTIKGKVIYSDNHSQIFTGIIKILKTNKISGFRIIYIENIHNGFFKFENIKIEVEDNIQIMAYPYDLDRIILEPFSEDNILIMAYPYDLDRTNIGPESEDNIQIMAYPYDLDRINVGPTSEDNIQIMAYPYDLDRLNVEPTSEDNIHIMAYPYDLDNSGFINTTADIKNIINNSANSEIEIIIEIKRANLEEIKTSTDKLSTTTVSREEELNKNSSVKLNQNFPNPFNPSTLISFDLDKATNVTLQVYSMSGKLISTLINNKYFAAGNRHVQFNANDLPSGIYVYKLIAGDQTLTKKMMLLK